MSTHYAEATEYSGFAKLMHWLVAGCVLALVPIGYIMSRIGPGDVQNALYNLHRSLGFTVLVLMLVRLSYRVAMGAPEPAPSLSAFHRAASAAVHHMLYLLLILQGVVGWTATSAFGAPIMVFGMFRLPDFVSKNEAASKQLFMVHDLMGYVIAALVVAHVGAALFHHFVLGNDVVRRMLP